LRVSLFTGGDNLTAPKIVMAMDGLNADVAWMHSSASCVSSISTINGGQKNAGVGVSGLRRVLQRSKRGRMNAVLQRRLADQTTAIAVEFPDPGLISINVRRRLYALSIQMRCKRRSTTTAACYSVRPLLSDVN
jgi:hypothetical protein